MQELLKANIKENIDTISRLGGQADTFSLPWGEPATLPPAWKADIVLAADVIYHADLMKPLLTTLAELGERHCADGSQLLLDDHGHEQHAVTTFANHLTT